MNWQSELKKSLKDTGDLKKYFKLKRSEEKAIDEINEIHPMRVTRYYMSLINPEDPRDPIRKMVVPANVEFDLAGTYDTSGEFRNTIQPGLQHKYRETAVIISTNRCFNYCRFCFRKRLVGLPTKEVLSNFRNAVDYIIRHKEITNVLITGGDPFALSTDIIEKFLEMISPLKHLDFIRFGTRCPVAYPMRITKDKTLLRVLKKYNKKKRIYIVTHFNHPREITNKSTASIRSLSDIDIASNNQTVLMKGINDDSQTIVDLCRGLTKIGVAPYYIFQCRPVKRVKKGFSVPLVRGCKIIAKANQQMDGHSKRFKFAMSHKIGKMEILGIKNDKILFKQHQARNPELTGKIYEFPAKKDAYWFDDFRI